ncbi:MAG TPA: arsenic efflux protein [Firmicutes bacterium]|nr:arsenic efflux protein [Bacillota bacterium]
MFREILRLLVISAENAFIQVTVFVGAVLLLFGYIDYLLSGRLVKKIGESKKYQPIIGAFLGLTPGCGGAIFVMPLFPRGIVSFGTVIATLLATMGDSSFVLISVMPRQWILVSIISFVVAIAVGYIVDRLPIGERLLRKYQETQEKRAAQAQRHEAMDHSVFQTETGVEQEDWVHIGHAEGDEIDLILHHELKGHQDVNTFGYKATHSGYIIYWVLISLGLILGIMDLFQVDLHALPIPNLALTLGIIGTGLSVLMMVFGRKFLGDDTHEEAELKLASLKETFIHNAQETAFVGTWVFAAYFAYELFVLFLGSGSYLAGEMAITNFLTQTGLMAVIIGVLIGIIPGCGPQIIFVTLFTRGLVPFAALLGNALSQDGDALFPLIAIDKRSAVWATIINTIPALIVAILAYWIEIRFF